ncbi:hypothetical protein ACL7TT_20315 [Microbulbifer sp. 2304DJ12-6]|uniref:hypothetical protein n=1 Tax=Microbulbifer sp. 2304DJ12-6 TaxID=3233340 RepID=UPI0039AE9B0B
MSLNFWLMLGIFIVGIIALIGFFKTKTGGYGRFSTSTFLILISIIVSSLLYSAGKLDSQIMANVLFAVIGFAGGLFTGKENNSGSSKGSDSGRVIVNFGVQKARLSSALVGC